jgi:hypothetical protein
LPWISHAPRNSPGCHSPLRRRSLR